MVGNEAPLPKLQKNEGEKSENSEVSRGVALGVEFEIGKSGHLRPLAATCRKRPIFGHLRPLDRSGHLRPLAATRVAASGCKWLRVVVSVWEWLQVAASGCVWL